MPRLAADCSLTPPDEKWGTTGGQLQSQAKDVSGASSHSMGGGQSAVKVLMRGLQFERATNRS
jgi:hypothetical protein